MKVLHLIDSSGLYGEEKMLLNLCMKQLRMGIEPTIGSIGEYNCSEKKIEKECAKLGIKCKKFIMKKGLDLPGAIRILEFTKCEKFNILHSHGYKSNIHLAFLKNKIRDLPVLATIHGSTRAAGINKMLLYEIVDKISWFNLDAIVYVSKTMEKKAFYYRMMRSKTYIVNNGIEYDDSNYIENASVIDKEIKVFCNKGYVLGTFGRLSEEKGYLNLINALYILKKKYQRKSIRLIIFGEGKQRGVLQKRINQKKLNKSVLLAGYYDNVMGYAKLLDLYVVSSVTEGWPISLLEIMGKGIPVISTSVGGIPELLEFGKAGICMKNNNPEYMAQIINYAINNPKDLGIMGVYAKNVVRKKYSSRKMAEDYYRIYNKLVEK